MTKEELETLLIVIAAVGGVVSVGIFIWTYLTYKKNLKIVNSLEQQAKFDREFFLTALGGKNNVITCKVVVDHLEVSLKDDSKVVIDAIKTFPKLKKYTLSNNDI